ncbi:MAG: hypothetical protein FJ119_00570 [Deltaproteobacteria bacterium]|nr:hypothetical protein [Deltaproteobacteria bacterium]
MKKNSLITVLIVIAAVVLACAAGYFYAQNKDLREQAREQLEAERAASQERASGLEQKVEELETRLREDVEEPPPAEVLRGAIESEETSQQLPEGPGAASVQIRVMNFFRYLDSKGYAQRRGFDAGSQELFMTALQRLDTARPLIGGENQDLLALMKNMTFFFRTLGKDTLLTARDIVNGESAIMEPVMALFYEWLNPWQPQPEAPAVSREMMYAYTGFFLQSMGGRAYLFRRESGIRMLALYYSILVLDQANRDGLNSEGIDIVPPLEALIEEMRYSRRLSDRHRYLETLREIRGRY